MARPKLCHPHRWRSREGHELKINGDIIDGFTICRLAAKAYSSRYGPFITDDERKHIRKITDCCRLTFLLIFFFFFFFCSGVDDLNCTLADSNRWSRGVGGAFLNRDISWETRVEVACASGLPLSAAIVYHFVASLGFSTMPPRP